MSCSKWLTVLKRTVQIVLAWQGFRYDIEGMSTAMKIGYFLTILALAIIGFVLGSVAAPAGFLAALVVFGWASYYIGNTLCLTRINRALIGRFGEQHAWHIYVILCGCMFSLQSIAFQSACSMHVWPIVATPFQLFGSPTPPMPLPINGTDMTSMSLAMSTLSLSDPTMPQPELPATLTKAAVLLYMAGVFLLSAGFLIKFAATWSGGLDIYYYKDMFHGRDTGTGFIVSGIYQYIDSPMYGLGNIQMYGLALMGNDWMALLIALAFHISIFAFNVLVEQPFVKKTYGGGTNGATNTSNSLFDEEDKMSNQI